MRSQVNDERKDEKYQQGRKLILGISFAPPVALEAWDGELYENHLNRL